MHTSEKAASSPLPPGPVAPLPLAEASAARSELRGSDKAHLVLAYLGLLCLIPLAVVKDSEFVQWHARNGLVLTLASLLLWAVSSVSLWLSLLALLVFPVSFILSIIGIVKALQGERFEIPLLSGLVAKF